MAAGILVVEDDPAVSAVLRRVLRRIDPAVVCVGTGREALAHLATGGTGLVVLDLGLPDLDGREVCRTARSRGFTGAILVVSARYGADVPSLALAAGADDFMAKPFTAAGLESRARALLA
jgi:DNA-binding response OmpR family regulator